MTDAFDDSSLTSLELAIDEWLARFRAENPVIESVDRGEPGDTQRRWFVRMRGDEKEFTTVWLVLGQRTLQYETYVMPAPEENAAELYEQLVEEAGAADLYGALADVYVLQGRDDEAAELVRTGLALADEQVADLLEEMEEEAEAYWAERGAKH